MVFVVLVASSCSSASSCDSGCLWFLFLFLWLPLVPVPAPAPVLVGASALAPFLGLLVCDCCWFVMSLLVGIWLDDLP